MDTGRGGSEGSAMAWGTAFTRERVISAAFLTRASSRPRGAPSAPTDALRPEPWVPIFRPASLPRVRSQFPFWNFLSLLSASFPSSLMLLTTLKSAGPQAACPSPLGPCPCQSRSQVPPNSFRGPAWEVLLVGGARPAWGRGSIRGDHGGCHGSISG